MLRPGLRARIAALLYTGAIAELRPGSGDRIVDAVARDANVAGGVGSFRASTAGGLVAAVRAGSGERAILRVAGAGWPGDPSAAADALAVLEAAGAPAPRLLARGQTDGASWTLERFVPGARPVRLEAVGSALAATAARLPRRDGRPDAPLDDLDRIASALPRHAERVRSLRARVATAEAPAIMRHGDLWLGNVLTGHDGTFVVDWEGWAPGGMPGADLLHLYATEQRIARRCDMGEVWRDRPWRDDAYRRLAAPYWASIGWSPPSGDDDLIGVAWWAAEVAGTLARVPERVDDARWVSVNVEDVLVRSAR